MYRPFDEFFRELQEKNEHKLSDRYKLLSPKMKKAVDEIFKFLETKPSDLLSALDDHIEKTAKKYKLKSDDLVKYFEKETLEA